MLNILNWRNLRKSTCRKYFLTFLFHVKQVKKLSWERCPWYFPEKSITLISKDGGYGGESKQNYVSPGFLVFAHTLCPIIFLHSFPLFIKPNKNIQIQPFLPVFISLWRRLCHIKLILNKLLCFSLVNLSFINLIYSVPAREPGRGKRKNIFPFPTHAKQNDLDSFVHGRQFKCVPYENLWIEIVMSSKLSNMSLPEIIMLS